MVSLMYRRPKSLEALLEIRTTMSEEAGHDMTAFVELVRTGVLPTELARTVTREAGTVCDDAPVAESVEAPVEATEDSRR